MWKSRPGKTRPEPAAGDPEQGSPSELWRELHEALAPIDAALEKGGIGHPSYDPHLERAEIEATWRFVNSEIGIADAEIVSAVTKRNDGHAPFQRAAVTKWRLGSKLPTDKDVREWFFTATAARMALKTALGFEKKLAQSSGIADTPTSRLLRYLRPEKLLSRAAHDLLLERLAHGGPVKPLLGSWAHKIGALLERPNIRAAIRLLVAEFPLLGVSLGRVWADSAANLKVATCQYILLLAEAGGHADASQLARAGSAVRKAATAHGRELLATLYDAGRATLTSDELWQEDDPFADTLRRAFPFGFLFAEGFTERTERLLRDAGLLAEASEQTEQRLVREMGEAQARYIEFKNRSKGQKVEDATGQKQGGGPT